jgi:hypothetical protein
MERHLEGIGNDLEALVWAVGCLWALRVEGLIVKFPPALNAVLFLASLYVGVNYLLTHLAWYGLPHQPTDPPEEILRSVAKVAIFIGLLTLVGLVAPGHSRRRVFAACAFPLMGLLALCMTAVGTELVSTLSFGAVQPDIGAILRGLVLGAVVAAPLALPSVLLYRTTAAPVANLALLPAIAKAESVVADAPAAVHTYEAIFLHAWPYICSLALTVVFVYTCDRWQHRPFDRNTGAGPR